MAVLTGQCHCGALRLRFETERPLSPRACQCSFCRKQNARMVSDPEGSAELRLGSDANRYRFGTGTTDFISCSRCGTYVGAVAAIDGRTYATLNLNVFDDPHSELDVTSVSYDGETAESRAARRRRKWTPATLFEA